MNRRKFLSMLGLAPVAIAAAQAIPVGAAAAPTMVDPLDEEYRNLCAALSQRKTMPKFANGGMVRPGPYLVGERGPEIISFNTNIDPREVVRILKKYQQRGGEL